MRLHKFTPKIVKLGVLCWFLDSMDLAGIDRCYAIGSPTS
jgi:hypothetical protein